VAAEVRRGLECSAARRSVDLTEWDGNLEGLPIPSPASGGLLSATGLQKWAGCGFRYFLGNVLRLEDRDDPERIVDIGAQDRGTGVHEVLERFFLEVIEAGAPDPDTAWSSQQRARLQSIADDVFANLERGGRTGRAVHWRVERQRLGVLLDDFLSQDNEFRATARATPAQVELPFGMEGAEPVVILTTEGRSIRFRGKADRVDVTPDGRHLISDYKTGRGLAYKKMEEGDPVRGGTTLQLGLYSEAALQLLGAPAAEAHYWMVDDRVRFERRGYQWDEARRDRFVEVVTAIVNGIEQGVFPAVPGEWDAWRGTHTNCTYCEFDNLCPRDRGESAAVKVNAPQLKVRAVLGPLPDEDDA
jgi:hypothetical protein